ncbi:hypothetical protein CANARDRAFT_9739 [[Candida] arabinofermentans NRRL YB-2248]|uniref:Major facilitator superfamily (MFS) profile domain-containing protein n=1 Tax=[Candida] arabinofermentans NRRL YB-2248 TaxID=983967 RepID=A0A1E4SV07_9ASCO|nr:hypothetical protein CANARDRAFT_9739 [[Candida] arabinofermentans NRRL YB-2248]
MSTIKPKKTITLQDQTNILPKKQLVVAFAALSLGLLVSFIDQTSTNINQPEIAADLNALSTVSWAGTSMFIGQTVFQILSGRLSDIFNRKNVLLFCLVLLMLTQLATSFCKTATQLFIFRGFAGLANGGITSLTMMAVSDIVTLEERGKYQGILGTCVALGNAIGPFISSGFAKSVNWKGIYWLACPLTACVTIVSYFFVPKPPNFDFKWKNFKKIDYYGFFTSVTGIILFLVAISAGGNTYSWNSNLVIVLLTIGSFFLILFFITQWKISKLPMMPLRLYKDPSIALMLFQNILFGIVYSTNISFIPLYFELVRGHSAISAACLSLPMVLTQSVSGTICGFLISKYKRYNFVIQYGFTMWTLGVALQMGLFNQSIPTVGLCFIMLVQGAGIGGVFQPTIVALQAHCLPVDRAVVIATRNFNRSVGGSVGIAAATSIMSNTFKSKLSKLQLDLTTEQIASLEKNIFGRVDMSHYSASDKIKVKKVIYQSLHSVFIFLLPLIAFCWITCFLIKDSGLSRPEDKITKHEDQEEDEEEESEKVKIDNTNASTHDLDAENINLPENQKDFDELNSINSLDSTNDVPVTVKALNSH